MVSDTLLDRAVMMDSTRVRDRSGGWTTTWTARPPEISCRFGRLAATATDPPRRDPSFEEPTASLLLPLEVAFKRGDRVQQTEPEFRLWTIVDIVTPPSHAATVNRVLVREV